MGEIPEIDNQHSVRSKWDGRTYCQGRWTFWKQRLRQLAEDTALDAPCQEYAKRAYEAMNTLNNEA